MLEILKELKLKCDFETIFRFCYGTVLCFAQNNLLDKSLISTYTTYLRVQYLLELSRNPVNEPIRFLFAKLAECLELDFALVKDDCEKARTVYIKMINEKQR